MSRRTNRPFTAELQRMRTQGASLPDFVPSAPAAGADNEVMAAIQDLRSDLKTLKQVVLKEQAPEISHISEEEKNRLEEELRSWRARIDEQRGETERLQHELTEMVNAIDQTKKEIAALIPPSSGQDRIATVTNELDAVVEATEKATETILDATEKVDTLAHTLKAHTEDSYTRQMADDIAEVAVRIFESCNFQDLTGQRITKIVNTLKFIEDRVAAMMEIWGRESLVGLTSEGDLDEDAALLHGPTEDDTRIDQSEIDKLFG